MGNFERLSVLVIVVVIVMILIVALVQLTNDPSEASSGKETVAAAVGSGALTTAAPSPPPGLSIKPPPPSLSAGGDHPAPPPAGTVRVFGDGLTRLNTDSQTSPPTGSSVVAPDAPVAPPTTVEAPKPAETKIVVVQPGDTIQKIAKQHYPNAVARATDAILKANPTVDASRMRVGTKLTIPALDGSSAVAVAPAIPDARPNVSSGGVSPGASYTVRSGDTLASIARRAYGASNRWHEIWIENFDAVGDDVDHPRAGTKLKIPR